MIFNITYDPSVSNAPAAFKTAISSVVQFFQTHFTNPMTVNIDVGYGEVNGQPLSPLALGQSESFLNSYGYSQIKSALSAHATSADAMSAANSLPNSDPTNAGTYWVTTAEAKALGLSGASGSLDGYVGFSSTSSFAYDDSQGVPSGQFDFFAVVAHEFSEIMGRQLLVGGVIGTTPNSYEPLDLFHFSASGKRTFSGIQAGFFSIDGGNTDLDNFNTNPSGDAGDWASSAGNDAFLAFSKSGGVNAVTETDLRELNVLGYDRAGTTPVAAPGSSGFTGDFNGDLKSDIIWQSASGTPTMWLMNGATVSSSTALPTPPSSWHIVGTGDFNGDGKSDILWFNTNNTPGIWEMNGTSIISAVALPASPSSWNIVGTGDFDGDGKSDILWQNSDGTPGIWEMNGTSIKSAVALQTPPSSWHIVGTGDFNGDHRSDILWQNTDGTPAIWEMNGTSIISAVALPAPPLSWHIVGTGDVNGDGMSDILWQNSDGTPGIWEMNGTSIMSSFALPNPGPGWNLLSAGDFDGDGKSELLFLNPSTRQTQIWTVNGTQVASMQAPVSSGVSVASSSSAAPSSGPILWNSGACYPDRSLGGTARGANSDSVFGGGPFGDQSPQTPHVGPAAHVESGAFGGAAATDYLVMRG
jgi:VCBS repeat protein